VHRLRKNWSGPERTGPDQFFLNRCTGQSPAESDDTRGCIYTVKT